MGCLPGHEQATLAAATSPCACVRQGALSSESSPPRETPSHQSTFKPCRFVAHVVSCAGTCCCAVLRWLQLQGEK
jgi:hypothetical protein